MHRIYEKKFCQGSPLFWFWGPQHFDVWGDSGNARTPLALLGGLYVAEDWEWNVGIIYSTSFSHLPNPNTPSFAVHSNLCLFDTFGHLVLFETMGSFTDWKFFLNKVNEDGQ